MSDIVVMVELTVPQSETGIICVIHWAMQMTVILYSAEHWDNSYRFLLWHLSKKKKC